MKRGIATVFWSALALALLSITSCREKQTPHLGSELPAVDVRTIKAEPGATMLTEDVVGTVRSRLRANVEAKVSARIEKVLVAPGQKVTAGELLAQLDAREIQARLDQARASFEQAELDHKRFASLTQQDAVARAEFDAVQARFRIATAAVAEAETTLAYTKVIAPFAGVISRKLADVGDLAAPGKALFELEDPSALRFEADLPESLISKVSPGQKLRVRISTMTNELDVTVSEIAPTADPGSRTFLVKMDLPREVRIPAGQFGRVVVPIAEGKSILVPPAAISVRGQMETVFVVHDGHAQLRLVKSGKHVAGNVEILAGIEPGEMIVTGASGKLSDGRPVQLRQ